MRRIVGLVLLGFAGFLLAMTAMVKWYAYPTLAVVPLDQNSNTTSLGEGMTYFDKATLSEQTDTLTSHLRTIGQVKAAEDQGDNVAIWDQAVVTTNSAGDKLSVTTQHAAFDRTTGEAVDCCDTTLNDEPITYKGLLFKFPFNTQKTSYQWFDNDLKDTMTMTYDTTETVGGLSTYKFHGTVPPTMTETIDVPSKVLGEPAGEMLSAENWYSNDVTFWVEPETGVIIKSLQTQNTTLRYNGEDRVVATKGTTAYPDSQVQDNVDEYKGKSGQLHLLRAILPVVGLVGGLLALVVGGLLVLTSRKTDEAADESSEAVAAAQS
ncbi:MAG: DUF3068 domain-containing protein [Nocardioidaceae bacterium]